MTQALKDFIFVTGLYRSGTTLLDKLLHAHPQLCVGSQPLAALIIAAKQLFLKELKIEQDYPLSHGFLEEGYQPEVLAEFLAAYEFTADDLAEIFALQKKLNGPFCLPSVLEHAGAFAPGGYAAQWRTLQTLMRRGLQRDGAQFAGLKEINAEEFLPYFLGEGATGILIIRDPRDVVVSSVAPGAKQFIGESRPTLYTLRCWRKSVQTAIALSQSANFQLVRFEELVGDTPGTANKIFAKLGLAPVDFASQEVFDQLGKPWRANSSTEDVGGQTVSAIGRYQSSLTQAVLNYVETVCGPEMAWMGYEFAGSSRRDSAVIREFREPIEINHRAFAADYSSQAAQIEAEIQRLEYLAATAEPSGDLLAKWFNGPQVYNELKRADA